MPSSNNNDYLKIGDVARLVGTSPTSIRMWESLGLARPRRSASKYRLYSRDDVRLLKRASFLRKVRGMNAPAIVQTLKREGLVQPARDGAASAVGGRLRQLRLKKGSSLAIVADAVGVSVGFLSAIERSIKAVQKPEQPFRDVEIALLRPFEDVVVNVPFPADLGQHAIEALAAFLGASQRKVGDRSRDAAVSVFKRMDRHEPQVCKRRLEHRIDVGAAIEPG